jgi:hypothetical protein
MDRQISPQQVKLGKPYGLRESYPRGISPLRVSPAFTSLPTGRLFWKSIKANVPRRTMEKGQPRAVVMGGRFPNDPAGEGCLTDRRLVNARPRTGPSEARRVVPVMEVLAMREVFMSTLSQVVELGIFAAAAGALAVGMMHVR